MRDKIHGAVRRALEKELWSISKDLFRLRLKGKTKIEIDLEARKLSDLEQKIRCIFIEVKTLGGKSVLHDFYRAYGQYHFYKYCLAKKELDQDI
ncbi:MAG: element excision factor XisH family protein [Bacteroidota bacterium]